MIDYELFCKIRSLKDKGLSGAQIAGELDLDPRTVYRRLDMKQFCKKKSTPRKSKLDPFKDDIFRMLETHPFSATQVMSDNYNSRSTTIKIPVLLVMF
jgi:transposase